MEYFFHYYRKLKELNAKFICCMNNKIEIEKKDHIIICLCYLD